jgi:membrane-associated phospholipid phosphatase
MKIFLAVLFSILLNFAEAQQADSAHFYNKNFRIKSYIIPAVFVAYGLSSFNDNGLPSSMAVRKYRNENFATFNNSADDYIAFAPGLFMLGLDLFHVKSTSNFANQVALTGKSIILSLAVVNILKYSTQVIRPDNTSENSFPSGHTAFAFTLAEVLHQEFKDKPLVYITGYTIATTVGAMRILNNRHWFSDVMVGAGIGMAATKLIYATHQYKWKMNNKGFLPIIGANQAGFIYQF